MLKIEFIQEQKYRNYIGIYGIKNIINNKIYIGQTRESFIKRYWHHRCLLNNNHHDNPHLQSAWNKYGSDNFIFIDANITDLMSWPIGTVWHHERLVDYLPLEIREFDIDHTNFKHTFVQAYKRDEKTGKIDHFF